MKRKKEKLRHGSKRTYTKAHWKRKQARFKKENIYPLTRPIKLWRSLISSDMRWAVFIFILFQGATLSVALTGHYPEARIGLTVIGVVIGIIAIGLSVRLIRIRQTYDPTRRKVKLSTILTTLLMMLAGTYLFALLTVVFDIPIIAQPNQTSVDNAFAQSPLPMLFIVVVVAPFIEETVFRELVPHATGPSILSFMIASIVFLAMHSPSGWQGVVSYGIVSSGFLYARLKDNNIYTPILIHMIWNSMSFIG